MKIKIKEVRFSKGAHGRTEVDYNFLGTNYARKVYVVKRNCRIRLPRYPHQHPIAHTLILVDGSARLAYKDSTGNLKVINMEIAKQYFIPPNMPHHLEIEGGIVESYFPKNSYVTSKTKIKTFNEKFFK